MTFMVGGNDLAQRGCRFLFCSRSCLDWSPPVQTDPPIHKTWPICKFPTLTEARLILAEMAGEDTTRIRTHLAAFPKQLFCLKRGPPPFRCDARSYCLAPSSIAYPWPPMPRDARDDGGEDKRAQEKRIRVGAD